MFATLSPSRTVRFRVFALRTSVANLFDQHDFDPRVYVITSATALNPNLRAQGGLFTLLQPTRIDDRPPDLRTVLERVESTVPADARVRWKFPLLVELTMPVAEAKPLLSKLAALGVSAATTDPGLRGIVDSLKEKRW